MAERQRLASGAPRASVVLAKDNAHYRPDIDGLRAIAVGLVVFYHAFPSAVPGGFVGVDVFFVISGYLITSILLREHRAGEFTFLGFYARRARRILPALLVVLAATWFLGRSLLLLDEFESLGRHTAAGATFTSNILLWRESGYFDAAAQLKPLLHLWSLAIEEQFYLLWPLLLALAIRWRWNLHALVGALLCASLGVNLATVASHPSFAFYLLPARFWELLIGCGLACVPSGRVRFANLKAGVAGVALLAVAFVLDRTRPYPSFWALVPTVATALFISAGPSAFVNRHVLSQRAAVFVGLVSYPLYLWHWPLFSIAYIIHGAPPPPWVRGLLIVASLVLAWLTFRIVERPAQTRLFAGVPARARARRYVVAGCAGLALLGAVGGLTVRGLLYTAPQKRAAMLATYSHYSPQFEAFGQCFLTNGHGPESVVPFCTKNSAPVQIVVWGDSFARHLFPPIQERMGKLGEAMLFSASACLPVAGLVHQIRPECVAINEFVIAELARLKPKVVLMEGLWNYYWYREDFFAKLDATIARVQAAGVAEVIVVGQMPEWHPTLPRRLARRYVLAGKPVPERSPEPLDHVYFDVDRALERHFRGTRVRFVSALAKLCRDDGCIVRVGDDLANDVMAFDAGHLTNAGMEYVYQHVLAPVLAELLPAAGRAYVKAR